MADLDSQISLKLLIDTRSNKVIFGEAKKDFVDFMFSLLTLPLSSIIKLLSPPNMVGATGHLYQSIENLDHTYFLTNKDKFSLLDPKVPIFDAASPLRLKIEKDKVPSVDEKCSPPLFSAAVPCFRIPPPHQSFGSVIISSHSSATGANEEKMSRGFVQGVITFMIKDDLEVTPMSAISSIALINRFSMKNAQLEEKVVVVGKKEGLALLKASLESVTVLTDVFCSSAEKINDPSHLTVNLEEL